MKETRVSQEMSSNPLRGLPNKADKDAENNGKIQEELTEPQPRAEFSGQSWFPWGELNKAQ